MRFGDKWFGHKTRMISVSHKNNRVLECKFIWRLRILIGVCASFKGENHSSTLLNKRKIIKDMVIKYYIRLRLEKTLS